MRIRLAALALLASVLHAHAQTPGFYILKDQSSPQQVLSMKTYTTGGITTPSSISSDLFGNPISGTVGTTNPNATALYIQGVTGGIPVSTSITGSLPSFGSPQHFVCDSGCGGGLSVAFGGAIGANGAPGGFKDISGNFQALLGDVTNGQWVSVKASVLPAGAATQTTLANILAFQSVNSATLAHTCSVAGYSELGCLGQIDDDVKGPIPAGSNTIGAVTQSGSWTIGITGSVPLPTGAATAALQGTNSATTAHTCSVAGYSILGCLGQIDDDVKGSIPAGSNTIGSIANTSFAATQATASALNATVVGTGTFAVQLSGATNNINNISGTISLPTLASTSTLQTTINTNITAVNTVLGTTADTAYAGSGSASVIAALKGIYTIASGPVAGGTNTIGAVTQASGPWSMNVTQVLGSAISATNGLFSNQLQNNAVLSQTNPSFTAITDGTNKAAVKPASTQSPATDASLSVTINAGSAGLITPGPTTPALSVPTVPAAYSPTHIAAASTVTSKSGAGMLHTVCVNSLGTVSSSVSIYDNTAGLGTSLGVINSLALLGCQTYDVAFATGLTFVVTGTVSPDVTASWR